MSAPGGGGSDGGRAPAPALDAPGPDGPDPAPTDAVARLFVAVWPPPAVAAALEDLPRPDEPGVRWVPAGSWHVTLRFLGPAPLDRAAAALDGLRASPAVAEVGPAVSRLGRSVLCLPVGGLDDLAATVAQATADVGQPPDPRPFAGHVTLARLRRRGACGVAGQPFRASFEVGEVALVRSRTTHEGPVYTTVRRVPLAG